ncbi:MAG: YigZ family protein, partial [bacterium]
MEIYKYKTVVKPSEGLYREKGSKFIAILEHVESERNCMDFLQRVKKEYHDARHHCYAYRINPENEMFRSQDDGEPTGSAGKPILNQILSNELFNVMIIVVRYFGGTKLGVSGLINAYKTSSGEAIDEARIVVRHLTRLAELRFDYSSMNNVMRVI